MIHRMITDNLSVFKQHVTQIPDRYIQTKTRVFVDLVNDVYQLIVVVARLSAPVSIKILIMNINI